MTGRSKQSWCPILMFGMALVFAATTAGAVPLAGRDTHPENKEPAKSKTVHFIGQRPEANAKVKVEAKEGELPLSIPEQLPASEPQALEFKGVRG